MQLGHVSLQRALCLAVEAAGLICSSDLATSALEEASMVSFYLKLSLLMAFFCSV